MKARRSQVKWQPTPAFLPGESQGRGSLVGYRLWGRTESDTTEAAAFPFPGTTQRDGMGREEGGGFRMGNTCIPVAGSLQYLAKPIQYCKV